MTEAEFSRMNAGFAEHSLEHGNRARPSQRYTFVVMDGKLFVGCASGLTNDNGQWLILTNLFIEQPYRGQGVGATVLAKLEEKAAALGVRNMWRWAAAYEAPRFYQRQGYVVLAELEQWYPSGHSQVGLHKALGHHSGALTPYPDAKFVSRNSVVRRVRFIEREITDAELRLQDVRCRETSIAQGNHLKPYQRRSIVALEGKNFVGCACGSTNGFSDKHWFYLEELFLEKAYRGQGLGAELLKKLEAKAEALGVESVYTWTAGYEAPEFYRRQGYEVFCETKSWYPSGHSRIGFRKALAS
ncbi:MAG TPA: GNAT family N-acetyltransferase [Pyrinomonadaceae bacterium]|nr:GNAT family N-acetyltransferase [Pyrinomonadaceae bacterium]